MYALGIQTVLYELEMQCTKILQLLYDVTSQIYKHLSNAIYNVHGWLMNKEHIAT